MPCRISTNGLSFPVEGLIDTGAGSFTLLHPKHLRAVKKNLRAQVINMEAVPLAGYDSVPNGQVEQYFKADLVIDGHRLTTYFVICNTGRHDLIIGRKLLEDAGVWVGCKERALWWPDDNNINCKRDIHVPAYAPTMPHDSRHQADADRRDALINAPLNMSILQRSSKVALVDVPVSTTATHRSQLEKDLKKMESQLFPKRSLPPIPEKKRRQFVRREDFAAVGLDIATIDAPAFVLNTRCKGSVIGHISVYEIDKLIQDRREVPKIDDPDEELRQLLAEKLPSPAYAGATIAHFSKRDSNVLPPHRPDVDHNIKLTDENTLSSSPLYSMSLEQL